jgi:hypothetical protein
MRGNNTRLTSVFGGLTGEEFEERLIEVGPLVPG